MKYKKTEILVTLLTFSTVIILISNFKLFEFLLAALGTALTVLVCITVIYMFLKGNTN
jgi:tellurite resistance protein TehA-like permease